MKDKNRNKILIWVGITLLPYLYLIYDVGKFVRAYLTSSGGHKFNLPTETFIGFFLGFLMYCLPVLILACVFLKNKKFMRHLLLAQTVVILASSMVVFYFIPDYYSKKDLETTDDDWYDFWHIHVDWYGYGNLGWSHRKKHLKVLLELFEKFLNQAAHFNQPYQIWINIDLEDSSNDANLFILKTQTKTTSI